MMKRNAVVLGAAILVGMCGVGGVAKADPEAEAAAKEKAAAEAEKAATEKAASTKRNVNNANREAELAKARAMKTQPELRKMSPEELEKLKAEQEQNAEKGEPNPADPAHAEKAKALKLSEESHDWGTIPDDATVSHTFQAKNLSEKTVKISVAASCGCTVSKLDKDTIEPGEEVPITATFNPHGRNGVQTKTLTITVLEPAGEFAQQFITITSNVRPMLSVEPQRTWLQEVDHRSGKQEKITIISRKTDSKITGVDSNSEFIKATVGETAVIEENGEQIAKTEVTLDIGRGAPIGTLNGQLTIRSSDPAAKPLSTFVGAEIIGDVRANPATTMIRATAPGALISADVRVDTRSGKAFKVQSIDVETRHDLRLAADLTPASEDSTAYTVKISGTAPLAPGLIQGTLLVSTDSEGGETIRIPFTATVPRAQPTPNATKVGSAAGARPTAIEAKKESAQPVMLQPVAAPGK